MSSKWAKSVFISIYIRFWCELKLFLTTKRCSNIGPLKIADHISTIFNRFCCHQYISKVCWCLTAVAGGSSVSTVWAAAVEGAPWLSASTSVFTVTGRTPGIQRDTDTDTDRGNLSVCQKLALKVSQQWWFEKGTTGLQLLTVLLSRYLGGTGIKAALKQKKKVPILHKKTSQVFFSSQVEHRCMLWQVHPFVGPVN